MFTLVILLLTLNGDPIYQETIRVEECPDKEAVVWAVRTFAQIKELGAVKYKWSCIPDERT